MELPGFREKAISIAKAGIYDLRIHHDQVLTPTLFKKWRLEDVSGLTDEAERARDEVVKTLGKIDAAAARFEEKRAS